MTEDNPPRLDIGLDAFLAIYHKGDDLSQDLTHPITLDQAESLIPTGPGGWRKVTIHVVVTNG